MAIALPLLAILGLIRHSEQNRTAQIKAANREQMLKDMEELQRLCSAEAHFKNSILAAEITAGLPPRHSSSVVQNSFSPGTLANLQSSFAAIKGFRLITVIAGRENHSEIQIFHNSQQFADYPRPGQRAARTILTAIEKRLKSNENLKIADTEQRMLNNFTDSMFGSYFNPLRLDEDFASGFITRMQGMNLHTARRIIYDADKRSAFAYLAIFAESENVFSEAIKAARVARQKADDDFRFVLRPAKVFPFIYESADSRLHLQAPIAFANLNAGAIAGENLVDRLLSQGLTKQKPARYPHLLLSSAPANSQLGKNYFYARFAIFLLLCASLLALKHFQQHGMLKISIRGQLFVAVFLAAILPATAFLVTAYRYSRQQKILREHQLIQSMKTRLKLFELNIKSRDEAMSRQADTLAEYLHHNISRPEHDLQQIIRNRTDSTFPGVMLIRNDGLNMEIIDPDSEPLRKHADKLNFSRDIFFAAMIRFFDYLNLIQKSFHENLEYTPRGRRLKALSNIFTREDVENFCRYEGTAQTSKKENTTLRFLNFKILPQTDAEEKTAAILFMVQDIRSVIDLILENFQHGWSLFNHASKEGLIKTVLIGTYDLNAASLDYDKIWPANSRLDEQQMALLNRVAMGQAEVSTVIRSEKGPAVAMVARKIGAYPLIALSQCSMLQLAAGSNQTEMLLLLYFAYLMAILMILASILDELFAVPVKRMLAAADLTSTGNQVELINSFENELSQLTREFNLMNRQIKERERLQRFISNEAAQTISQESRELTNIAAQKTTRSILFIHIRGFSNLSEKLDASELIALLNSFFPFIEARIVGNGGQIDKYIGDAVMAVFANTPDAPTAASMACTAALAIKDELADLNSQLKKHALPEVEIGTGLASGEIISGRIGSYSSRLDYTVIGDRVNLAARLETMSHFDSNMHILVDNQTMQDAASGFKFAERGDLQIKGKTSLVKVYELLATN